MVPMVVYDGLGDPGLVELSSILVWVNILGLPPALLTPVASLLVGETLGSVVNLDIVGLRRGDLVRVLIWHSLKDPVKQAFPPMEFEFSPGVSALLRFKYDCFVGFCRLYGLLKPTSRVCLGPPFEASTVEAPVKNLIPSPKPNSLSRVEFAFLQLGSRSNASVGSSKLVFQARLLPKGGEQYAPLLLRKSLFGRVVPIMAVPPLPVVTACEANSPLGISRVKR
jgi:hypothetical protein